MKLLYSVIVLFFVGVSARAQRRDVVLDNAWRTVVSEHDSTAFRGFEKVGYPDREWKRVSVPHNWDAYGGYRRLRHGNLHGYAWYRRHFTVRRVVGLRYFLWFEGVGSYATVWVNGHYVGYHAGGRTTFTLDITDALREGTGDNVVAVRADHPAYIKDLPWVCGGCSDDRGFSEGSQPMGIFRPVHLVVTRPVRIEPFGVHVWNDTTASSTAATLYLETEIKNYGVTVSEGEVLQRLVDKKGAVVVMTSERRRVEPGETVTIGRQLPEIRRPRLWSTGDPYLYRLETSFVVGGKLIDRVVTPYGIRVIHWPDLNVPGVHPFLLNGQPVFINGIAEYEHRIGDSHAFTAAEIKARVAQIRAAGFNAFRDAHQPHNLLYQHYWDSLGILWWPQLSAHIWFDTPEFRKNFKTLLTEWIKERRNSPSVILWGLQNESKLPEDFARECSELIRQLDPTASSQRKITTCNGGTGTDWDVPQNWTGTYGGDPATYAADLRRQVLVGEYGAWRTADLHGAIPNSEDRMDELMEMKIRLADSVKGAVAGHFAWLYSSHDNPGRVQSGEGRRELDRIGPVNYKGLLTSWEEPLDAYYLYRANFAPAATSPMVYIVSHTWPDRWTAPGKKDGIVVYSNCEEVELYNDIGRVSLGRRKRGDLRWDGVEVRYNVLYAVGYVRGKAVARDCIVLHHLPKAPHLGGEAAGGRTDAGGGAGEVVTAAQGYHYLYRVNCGGPDYTDHEGHRWMADRHWTTPGTWGSLSWTDDYPGMPPFFGSQRRTADPIAGTSDGPLFADFRYGLDRLVYTFPVQDGDYRLELYFVEPWLGTGGGLDCTGWRLFDVAVNDQVVIGDLDIWKEAGHDRALKKVVMVHVTGGKLVLSFPHAAAGQALIAGLAIATLDRRMRAAAASPGWIDAGDVAAGGTEGQGNVRYWLDTGDTLSDGVTFSALPPNLYGAEWMTGGDFRVTVAADVFIGVDTTVRVQGYEDTHTRVMTDAAEGGVLEVYRRRFSAGAMVEMPGSAVAAQAEARMVAVQPATSIEPAYDSKPVTTYKTSGARVSSDTTEWTIAVGVGDIYSLNVKYRWLPVVAGSGRLEVRMEDGTLIREEPVSFATTLPAKWNYINTTTGTMINAGRYIIRLIAPQQEGLKVDELQVQ